MVNAEFLQAQEAYRRSIYANEVSRYITEPTSFLPDVDFEGRREFIDFYPSAIISNDNGAPICIDTVMFHHKASRKFSDKLNGGEQSILLFARDINSPDKVLGFVRTRIDDGHGHLKVGSMIATSEKGIARRLILMRNFVLRNPNFFTSSKLSNKLKNFDFVSVEVDNVNQRRLDSITDTDSPEYAEAAAQQEAWQRLFSKEMGYSSDPDYGMSLIINPFQGERSNNLPNRFHLRQRFTGQRYGLDFENTETTEATEDNVWNEAHEQIMLNINNLRETYPVNVNNAVAKKAF